MSVTSQEQSEVKIYNNGMCKDNQSEIKIVERQYIPCLQKIFNIFKSITVEPIIACFIVPSILEGLAVQNLGLEKACRVNKNYSTEICDSLIKQTFTTQRPEEIEVQSLVAYMNAWRFILQSAIPAILVLFIGAWSDHTRKRKPCMIVPIIGESCTAIGLMLCTYYFIQWPLEVSGLIESLIPALTGGWSTMLMGVYCYVVDHTTINERTYRIGMIDVFVSIGSPLGRALSGIMLKKIGFYGVFSVCFCLYITGLMYVIFRIDDDKAVEKSNGQNKITLKEVIHWRHIYETFLVLFKKRKGRRRLQVLLLILAYIMTSGPIRGANLLQYLFMRRHFKFNEVDFGMFSSYSIVVELIGVAFALCILNKYFQMDDNILAMLACASKICAGFAYAFAPNTGWLYLAPLVEFIGGTVMPIVKSMSSKVVEPNEIGKINSLFGVCEVILGLVYGPMYTTFYVKTVDTFPGAFYLLGASLTVPSTIIFLLLYRLQMADIKKMTDSKEITDIDEMTKLKINNIEGKY